MRQDRPYRLHTSREETMSLRSAFWSRRLRRLGQCPGPHGRPQAHTHPRSGAREPLALAPLPWTFPKIGIWHVRNIPHSSVWAFGCPVWALPQPTVWAFACPVFALRFASLRVHALVGRCGGRGNLILLVNSSRSLWVLEGDSHYDNQLFPILTHKVFIRPGSE